MKKKIVILLSALLAVIISVIATGCGAISNCEKWIENSANNLTVVKTVFEATAQ